MNSSVPSIFDAHGIGAARVAVLGWIMTLVAIVVTVVVAVLLLVALWRRRKEPSDIEPVRRSSRPLRWIVVGGLIVPTVILAISFVYTIVIQSAIADPPSAPRLTVQLTGHEWWWEVHYLDQSGTTRVITANEIHVPLDKPVRIELATADVIHSFWVPQLAGKTDLIPGQHNDTWIEAKTPGTYRGECAEYCGLHHANMALAVVVEDSASFERWLSNVQQPARPPSDSLTRAGLIVFTQASCAQCHTIQGTSARGQKGPDLTHLASRQTLGAGMLSNTPGMLAGWISNAPALKPGVGMPAIAMNGADLQALLAYLKTLQ